MNPPLRAYTIVIVSDVGLVTKTAPGQILVFAAHRDDRRTAAGLRGPDARRPPRPRTGADRRRRHGLASTSVRRSRSRSSRWHDAAQQVTISDPGNWALQAPARELVGYVYTDKPIYRPGQTVRVKGVLRWRTRDRLELFDASEVEVVDR